MNNINTNNAPYVRHVDNAWEYKCQTSPGTMFGTIGEYHAFPLVVRVLNANGIQVYISDQVNKSDIKGKNYTTPKVPKSQYEEEISNSITNRLLDIFDLKRNWDGYDGLPVTKETMNNCMHFIKLLPYSAKKQLDVENIFPNSNGTITFEWEFGNKCINIEIGKSTMSFFSILPNEEEYHLNSLKFPLDKLPYEIQISFDKILV